MAPDPASGGVTPLPHPLDGIRVLDFSRVVAGPIAGRMLSDLGADVVKVEPPEGDLTRVWGEVRHGLSGFYVQQNAGKRNVCFDLKGDRGAAAGAVLRRLAAAADIVIENFRPGVMERLGLGYDTLSSEHPEVIMLSISGFGQTGPERDRAAYAPVIHAESGLLARHSTFDEAWPSDLMLSTADTNAGLHGVVAVLSALWLRQRTGRGQHIDMAMLDAALATDDYAHHAVDRSEVKRLGGIVYDVCGGPLLVAGTFSNTWYVANRRLGVADPAPADADRDTKIRLRREALVAWFAALPDRATAKRLLDDVGLAWAELPTTEEAVASPQAVARGVVATIPDGGDAGGTRGVVQSPYRFSAAAAGVRGAAPHRGQHNAEVLSEWLGLEPEEIAALVRARILLGGSGMDEGTEGAKEVGR